MLWVTSSTDRFGSTMYGLAPNLAQNRPDLQVAIDQKAGDFIMTAFHEVQHLALGLGLPPSFRARCRAAYDALPAVLSSSASPIAAVAHARPGRRNGC